MVYGFERERLSAMITIVFSILNRLSTGTDTSIEQPGPVGLVTPAKHNPQGEYSPTSENRTLRIPNLSETKQILWQGIKFHSNPYSFVSVN